MILARRAQSWPTPKRRPVLFPPFQRVYQGGEWVNGFSLQPLLFRSQLDHRKMQVRCACIRITRGTHKTDDVPALDSHFLPQPFHVPVQVCVVVAISSCFVELVYGIATLFAEEQSADGS